MIDSLGSHSGEIKMMKYANYTLLCLLRLTDLGAAEFISESWEESID